MTDETKDDAQWREQLSPDEYYVLRQKGTERAFTGEYWNTWEEGSYRCRGCGELLFQSDTKFDAGCGWPSFDRPATEGVIEEASDHRDCYISALRIQAADKTDSRDYQLHLENTHGLEIHTVTVDVGEALSQETLIGAVCGGGFVLVLLLIAVFSCARRCCPNKQLKQDIER